MSAEEYSLEVGLQLNASELDNISKQIESIKVNPIKITLDFKAANSQIAGLKKALQSLSTMKFDVGGSGQSGISAGVQSQVKGVSQAYKELSSLQRQINGKQLKIASLDGALDSKKILKYYQDIQKLQSAIDKLGGSKALQGNELVNFEGLKSSSSVINSVVEKVRQAETAFKNSFDSSKMTQDISAIETKMSTLSSVSETTKGKLSELKAAKDSLDQSLAGGSIESVVQNEARYNQALQQTRESLRQDIELEKQRIQQQKELVAAQKLQTSKNDLNNQMSLWLKNNSAAAADFGGRIKALQQELKSCDAVRLSGIKSEFKEIRQEAMLAGKTGQSFGEQIGSIGKKFTAYFSAYRVITQMIRYLKEMYQNVYDINTAMTELRKVTEETEETYNRFLSNAKEDAGKVSATISEYVTATSNYARLGYSMDDSKQLAQTALLYKNVGDDVETTDDATESLISTMKGFNMEANESLSIVDKFNATGNNFAISSGGIGTALEKSAASLSAANNSLDESIGLITAANTIVQNPDIVGTAFKTKLITNCLYVQKCA